MQFPNILLKALYEKISDLINYPFIRPKILVAHKNLPMPTNYLFIGNILLDFSSYDGIVNRYRDILLKYFLSDAYLRFYFSFVQPNLKKIKSGIQTDLFGKVAQSGAFSGWMGRSFEYLCIEHAAKISKMLGFSGIRQSRRSWSPAVIQPVTLPHAVISIESSNPKNSFKYPFWNCSGSHLKYLLFDSNS